MCFSSARCNAGHFFAVLLSVILVWLSACGKADSMETEDSFQLPGARGLMIVTFSRTTDSGELHFILDSLSSTAGGLIHGATSQHGFPVETVAAGADSAGMLILAVINHDTKMPESREHLVITLDGNGLPLYGQPELENAMPPESLWIDPVNRQEAIRMLMDFFKPDLVIQQVGSTDRMGEILDYWDHRAGSSGITAAFLEVSLPDDPHRDWAFFTGETVVATYLHGLQREDFYATVFMLMGLQWEDKGYPAMEAFGTNGEMNETEELSR